MIPLQNICAEIFAHEIFQKGVASLTKEVHLPSQVKILP